MITHIPIFCLNNELKLVFHSGLELPQFYSSSKSKIMIYKERELKKPPVITLSH